MEKVIYPTVEKIIEYNILALHLLKVKKADKAEVLNRSRIMDVIGKCQDCEGDICDKAVVLLKGLIQNHPFASGNRRTAFIATKDFLLMNKAKISIRDDPKYASVMIGIRERYYSDGEIKEWIKNGKIKEFRR